MKYVVLTILALGGLGAIAMVWYVLRYEKTHQVVTCFVIYDNAPAYRNPGREFAAVRTDMHGMVDVVGRKGDWWKLTDGTYMPAYCLTLAHSGEYPRELKE